jgi:hypothetical protein
MAELVYRRAALQGSIPGRGKFFSFPHHQISSEGHLVPYPIGSGFLPLNKKAGAWG